MIEKRLYMYVRLAALTLLLSVFAVPSTADSITLDELTSLIDSARTVEADVFAPKTFQKAIDKYDDAKMQADRGKKESEIANYVEQAEEFAESALKATEVAKLTLADYLGPRERAREANAHDLAATLYGEAEGQFVRATEKVEAGNVKDGLKEAEKAVAMFDSAELEAIRVDALGAAVRLIAKAELDDAVKYAPVTLDKARSAFAKADSVLVFDRYDRASAKVHADRAEYEAQHASNIAQTVRSLNRNDQAWEKLMLVYEIEMDQIGQVIGYERLPFDNGPGAAADSAIAGIGRMKGENQTLLAMKKEVSETLTTTIDRLGGAGGGDDAAALAVELDGRVAELLDQNKELAQKVAAEKERLSQLTAEHHQVSAELEVRQQREAKVKKAKAIINPSEGDVLFNAAGDIVLRLHGLSFGVGKSDISDDQVPLLQKVEEVVSMFPDSKLRIEGHTDATGNQTSNRQLSEKRAYAVMQYIRQSMSLSSEYMTAVGYGSEKPVASNETADGRAKNRRIDIVIMQ